MLRVEPVIDTNDADDLQSHRQILRQKAPPKSLSLMVLVGSFVAVTSIFWIQSSTTRIRRKDGSKVAAVFVNKHEKKRGLFELFDLVDQEKQYVDPTTLIKTPPPTASPTPSPTTEDVDSPSPTQTPTTEFPSESPTKKPTFEPTTPPPTGSPTPSPTISAPETPAPTQNPTTEPPSDSPTKNPTIQPTTPPPTGSPTPSPTMAVPETPAPSQYPDAEPPSKSPTKKPTIEPTTPPFTASPSLFPTNVVPDTPVPNRDPPTVFPSENPTTQLTLKPTNQNPSKNPTTEFPSVSPTTEPTRSAPDTLAPSKNPVTEFPSATPTTKPTEKPPRQHPTDFPTDPPTTKPTSPPSTLPTPHPTSMDVIDDPHIEFICNDEDCDGILLQPCQGDCDRDQNCAGADTICYERSAYDEVPGCQGGGDYEKSWDFCILVTDVPPTPTSQPSSTPTTTADSCRTASRTVQGGNVFVFFEQFDTSIASDHLLELAFFQAYNKTDPDGSNACNPTLLNVERVQAEMTDFVGDVLGAEGDDLGVSKLEISQRQGIIQKQAGYAELIVLTEKIEFKTLFTQVHDSGLFPNPVVRGLFVGAMNEFFSEQQLPIYALGVKEVPTSPPTTLEPTFVPTYKPTGFPDDARPSPRPSSRLSPRPSSRPSPRPSSHPSPRPSSRPSPRPTPHPTPRPRPTPHPTPRPRPTPHPTPRPRPTPHPSPHATHPPSPTPNSRPLPSARPTEHPSKRPSARPTAHPTPRYNPHPTPRPTPRPSPRTPQTSSKRPTGRPTVRPTPRYNVDSAPTPSPRHTLRPTSAPVSDPAPLSSIFPTIFPSSSPNSSSSEMLPKPSGHPESNPASFPSSQPVYSPEFILREPRLDSVRMVLRGVPLLPSRSQLIWREATENAVRDEVMTILNNQIEYVDVEVKITSQKPGRFGALNVQPPQPASRHGHPDRFLQEPQGSSSSTTTIFSESDLTITFDVMCFIRAVVEDHDVRRYVGAALDSPGEKAVYIFQLISSGEESFKNLTSLQLLLPAEININAAGQGDEEDTETLATGMTVGIALVAVAGAALVVVGAFLWTKRRPNQLSQRPEQHVVSNIAEYEDNTLTFNVVEKPEADVSTLGDPIPHGVAAAQLDGQTESLAETASLPYDYKVDARAMPSMHVEESVASYSYSELSSNALDVQTDDDTLDAQYFIDFQITVDAPPGLLGLVLEEDVEGSATVYDIKELSPLADRINIGDKLVSVDDTDVSAMPVRSVMELIATKQNSQVRRLVFTRPSKKLTKR